MDKSEQAEAHRSEVVDELEKQNTFLKSLVANSRDMLYRMSLPDGRYEFVSAASLDLLGYTPEEFYASPVLIREMIHPDWHDYFKIQWQRLIDGDMPPFYEYQIIHKSGETRWLYQKNVLISDKKGTPVAIEGIVSDVTDRKRAEEENARLEEQYRQAQKVESIGRLAGGVSHDLNNLLTPILGYGEMLLSDLDPDDNRAAFVREIMAAGLRARDLVKQLLAFARKQTLEYISADLNDIIRGMENLLRCTIRENIDMVPVLSSEPLNVKADVGQIEQVILNLAVNAQDAMPQGGTLILETARGSAKDWNDDESFEAPVGECALLTVRDTGTGMDIDTKKHIFEPFFSTKGEAGTGLGLATVYGIVKQHGGNVLVHSETGKGTAITACLPLSLISGATKSKDKETLGDMAGSETILLVEDNDHVRRLVEKTLCRYGYTVLEAGDGERALDLMDEHKDRIQLLLTDVVMTGMNGKELYTQAKVKQPGLNVLFMSGYANDVISHHGVLEEGVAFIQKPFSTKTLAGTIRTILNAGKAHHS